MVRMFLIILLLAFATQVNADHPTKAKIKVKGNCGMCKKNIERAALSAGADKAVWNAGKKTVIVKFDSDKTTPEKIESAIADAGYDTANKTANEEAYRKLPRCCKYRD